MEIELSHRTEEEIEEIKENCPDGHIEEREGKVYWIFENEIEYGV